MAVYVDDMKAKYRNMVMCHMIADTHEELIKMAKRIGIDLKWIQNEGAPREHFDICNAKKRDAVEKGAVQITQKELSLKIQSRYNEDNFLLYFETNKTTL